MSNILEFVDKWWSSLTVTEKERIASRIEKRQVYYPECTAVWQNQEMAVKERIYNHCVNNHGDAMSEDFDGQPYGD